MDKLQDEYYCEDDDDEDLSEKEQIIMMSKIEGGGGWVKNAGKKLVMSGVVISCGPVLLPPLLVVSALALAMSIPFALLFASFACTHKLITKLLPPPPPLPNYHYHYSQEQEDDHEVKMSTGAEDINQIKIELVDDDEPHTVTTGSYPPNISNSNIITTIHHVDADGLQKEEDDENENENEREINNTKLIDEESSRSENENNILHVEDEMSVQVKPKDDANDATSRGVDVDEDEDKPKTELKEDKHSSSGLINHSNEQEEEWEKKINAIRVIVGFKAPRRSSYFEEVKALYLFTGIEPPTTSSSSDHQSSSSAAAELDAKLNFLMSVIGLK